jgi:hypothetical protein
VTIEPVVAVTVGGGDRGRGGARPEDRCPTISMCGNGDQARRALMDGRLGRVAADPRPATRDPGRNQRPAPSAPERPAPRRLARVTLPVCPTHTWAQTSNPNGASSW